MKVSNQHGLENEIRTCLCTNVANLKQFHFYIMSHEHLNANILCHFHLY